MKKRTLRFVMSVALASTLLLGGCAKEKEVPVETPEENTEMIEPETEEVQEEIETWKTPIEGLPDDFILGMDASSLLVEEKSGVKFFNEDGQEQDALKTFADAGINYIRLRVWNDPYDENGNGYGGGNNDLDTAIELGKRATDYGMKVSIDFHYSDFWADPKRQHAPKAWEGMSLEEKSDALYDYTKESLSKLLDAGVDVGMVQIGNEINYGMSGETKLDNVISLLKAGSMAVREVSADYGKEISIVVHYTRIMDKADVLTLVSKLVENDLDFDMIGMSYYPFWDGGMDNMSRVLELIQERYGKKVFLAETSYAYTTKDGDGSGNSFGAGDKVDGYDVSVEGQASIIHDICEQVNYVGGLGVFYWEGAWIPVGPATADNSAIWEQYGSGWASSYASDYDPEDAGLYYGGCSWDNQAFFDFDGHPLESLKVFAYMRKGN
ncbi:arabinogalactan endo-1,4-beta-galactosidase [Butyrivibrio sp. CB08]|uniref:glycoside hydrolase family 53 protein n=1 Tax=Butyrivibrio sp. CB08 TaxID=2364879 RepID=UPI000EA8CA98|nr:glycosyl hydrolase 53 family protein [Butyrivibrio sp. CB08]RKM59400.1 arabinogalactan endo-1,4-beta-galactosidase [Butyrivibrio sp. CB08]